MEYNSLREVSPDMLTALVAGLILPPPPPPDRDVSQPEQRGMAWFRQVDADGDGFLTMDEFPRRRMFAAFDKDGDDRLSLEELARAPADLAPPRPEGIPGVETRRDVSYRKAEGEVPAWDQRLTSLDLYLPTTILEKGERRPIIVYVHGGGWRAGDKSRVDNKPGHYCRAGYIFASVNYRLSPDVKHPTHAEDVAAAVDWIMDNAERLGGDPDRVVLMGHSAGAHLVALVATDPRYLGEHDRSPADLAGVVALDSASYDLVERADDLGMRKMIGEAFGDDAEALRSASPVHHVAPGGEYPAFLVVYAPRRLRAKRESERFAEAIEKVGGDAEVLRAEGKDHAAVNADATAAGDAMGKQIDEFLRRVLRPSG